MKKYINSFFFLIINSCISLISLEHPSHPFKYDLHLTCIPGKTQRAMVCFHGFGGDWRIAELLYETSQIEDTLITFNFPDHGAQQGLMDLTKSTFGTFEELKPALHVLKKCVIDEGLTELNLYGFSAGGGALINTLYVLNSDVWDQNFKDLGMDQEVKNKILSAIRKGHIILDTPLKSAGEILDFYWILPFQELKMIGQRYKKNGMEPIEVLSKIKDLNMHFIVHFQMPDEILSNRDDQLFIERLKKCNLKGTVDVVFGTDNGHMLPHPSLWEFYSQINKNPK